MPVQITVLGLGQIGTSIGLALAGQKEKILRVGNDREPEITRQVNKLGAFDSTPYNLPHAVEKADVVVLALPVDEIYDTLKLIAADLKPGAVVVNTSPLQVKANQWAAELIPPECHFVSLTPTVAAAYLEEVPGGVETAHADLFKDALMIITSPPNTEPDALKLAADLCSLLGGIPFFADSIEADGLLAAVHLLPRLLAAALVNATAGQPGWKEARKLASRAYANATSPVLELDERKELGRAALHNPQNSVRVLNNLVAELEALRDAIAAGDESGLAKLLEQASAARQAWYKARLSGDYNSTPANPLPTSGEILGRLIGFGKRREKKL
jgi:prephenate dehydrogenase